MSDDPSTIQELEEQEWDVGDDGDGIIEHEFMNGHEMQMKVQDPELETIMGFVSPSISNEDKTRDEETYEFVDEAIVSPTLPIEKWRDMRNADKVMLSNKVGEEVGVDRILGFHDGGLEERLGELLSESQENGSSQ